MQSDWLHDVRVRIAIRKYPLPSRMLPIVNDGMLYDLYTTLTSSLFSVLNIVLQQRQFDELVYNFVCCHLRIYSTVYLTFFRAP